MINVLVLLGCTLFKILFAILPPLNIAVASLTLPNWFNSWVDMPAFLALITTFVVVWLAEYSVKIAVFLVKIIRG
jgi:hypothetical protein